MLIKLHNITLAVALLIAGPMALKAQQNPSVTKSYAKSYTVNSNDKITLENEFGEMKINTWTKSEVKVEVTITAKSSTEERAKQILDRISIEDNKNSNGVSFKTKFNNQKGKNSGGHNEGFNIDYVAYVPSQNPLTITNKFGPITMGDYDGAQLMLESKFGSLKAGNLSNVKKINVEFGKAEIESIHNGDLMLKYSRGLVNKLKGSVDGDFEFCSGVKIAIDNDLKDITIKNKFTTLLLDLDKSLSASFDISTHFCKVRNKSDIDLKTEETKGHGPKFDYQYHGKTGTGSVLLHVNSEFGDVTLGHNLYFDINEKSSKKKQVEVMGAQNAATIAINDQTINALVHSNGQSLN